MKKVIFAALLIAATVAYSQGWTRTYGGDHVDFCSSIDHTSDGCYIVVGYTRSFGDTSLSWLLKVDSTGDTVWTRKYDGPGRCVVETSDKGFIIVGGSRLLKTDSVGNIIWMRSYSLGEDWRGSCVQETSDGNYIIVGSMTPVNSTDDKDLILLKVDSSGDSLWAITRGSERYDFGYCVRETSDGGYVVTGHWDSINMLWDASAWWFKANSEGQIVWEHFYGKGPDYSYEGYCIQETSDGGFIISGGIQMSVGADFSDFLIKADSNGYDEWIKEYNNAGGQYVQQTSDGGYVTTGYWNQLFKTDNNGDSMWTKNYGGSGYCVLQTADEGYIVAGTKEARTYTDIWLLKTDANGDTIPPAVEEQVTDYPAYWDVSSPVGTRISLRYSDYPQGFHASVFDASGRKVGELHSVHPSGTIIWGDNALRGVYFIKDVSDKPAGAKKVVIVK